MGKLIRVVVAEDTLVGRLGLQEIFSLAEDMEVVGSPESLPEVVSMIGSLKPDILVLDLKWSGDSTAGARVIRQLRALAIDVCVLAITAYPHLVAGAARAGADVVMEKHFTPHQFLNTVRQLRRMGAAIARVEQDTAGQLTAREIEVLHLMAEGLSDAKIAERLTISDHTARGHVRKMMAKLGAANRTDAVSIGYRRGLLKRRS